MAKLIDKATYTHVKNIKRWIPCPVCGKKLRFNKELSVWKCEAKDYSITETELLGKALCLECGGQTQNPEKKLCDNCRQLLKRKTAKGLLKAVTIASVIYAAVKTADEDTNSNYSFLPSDTNKNDENMGTGMRCENCKNTDEKTLWDEGGTIYCSRCGHRTSVETGEDDIVECPYCHRMRDRKAAYCCYCNDSTWKDSNAKEFAEIDKILKEYGC